MVPESLRYTPTHEWCRVTGNIMTMGVTEHALTSIENVTYVDLPEVGSDVLAEVPVGRIEGVDSARDVMAPFDGLVLEANDRVVYNPDVLTGDPYGEGWLIRMRLDQPASLENLLSAAEYGQLVRKRRR